MATEDLRLPAAPVPSVFVSRYRIDEVDYFFGYTWNDRDGFWYLRVAGSDRTTLATGIKLTLGADKLIRYKHLDIPQGSLDVVDTSNAGLEMRESDFGSRVILRYTPPDEADSDSREIFYVEPTPS